MEPRHSTIASVVAPLACIGAVVLACMQLWRLLNWVWLKPKRLEKYLRQQQGLRGNSYRLLFGDMKDISKMRAEARSKPIAFTNDYLPRANPFLHQTVSNYGKNSFTWMGPLPMVNITEPELIREAFSKIYDFQKPKMNPLVELLAPGLVKYEGEKWAKHRKLINPAFHAEKLKMMLPAFYTSCNEMINKWKNMVSETGSCDLDVWSYLVTLSADVISRAAFGSSYEEGRKIFQLLQEQTDLTIQMFLKVYIPGWRYLPTRTNQRMKQLNNEIQALLKDIIYKRKKAMKGGGATKEDLLGVLLQSIGELQYESDGQPSGMTIEEVIDECKLFYFAGQETTSVLLVWTMIMLAKHQDWQAQAREEVLRTFGNNKPHLEGLSRLKVVTMILYEVLRLYPPVLALTRRVPKETQLGKLSLPAGVLINLAIILTHHDEEIWGDGAKEFNPDRFCDGISKATKGNASFFPFGWGPRICIGQNFSLMEGKMALAMILQEFSFELSPLYAHAPTTLITLKPQFGAHVVLHRL